MSLEKQPLISIVIANYNYGRFLETAIQSVLQQCDTEMRLPSGDRIELIIVDGGSTDNSIEVIQTYSDRLGGVRFGESSKMREVVTANGANLANGGQSAVGSKGNDNFRTLELQNSRTSFLWCSEKDRGQSHAFNKGFARASGRFLTWLNADDILFPNGLTAVVQEIKKRPDCQWFVGSTIWLDEKLRVVRCFKAHRFSVIRARWGTFSVGGPSSFFRKSLLLQVGGVNEKFHFCMDTELWCRFFFRGRQVYHRTSCYVWGFRIHKDSKVSGMDVAPESTQACMRRQTQMQEASEIRRLYGARRNARLIDAVTLSAWDWFTARIEAKRMLGNKIAPLFD